MKINVKGRERERKSIEIDLMDYVKGSKISYNIYGMKKLYQFYNWILRNSNELRKMWTKSIYSFIPFAFYWNTKRFLFSFAFFFVFRSKSIVLFVQNETNWMENVFVWCRWIESRSTALKKRDIKKIVCVFLLNQREIKKSVLIFIESIVCALALQC